MWLFVRIQQSALDRESNIFGLLLHPKVRRTAKLVCALPEDAEKTPVVKVDGKDFKCASYVSLG